uniref:DUF5577 domain-containing protein n=1 Tax=Otus sunia TaxID=257818 RepID=A0A8C8ADC7_9STRI
GQGVWGRGAACCWPSEGLPGRSLPGRLLPAPPPSPAATGCCAMVSVTMATSEWIQFFKEAGIPPGPAVNYAVMFVDNRIQKNMLMDLNKEIMNELGITVVGDIIAILKHAKVVYRQDPSLIQLTRWMLVPLAEAPGGSRALPHGAVPPSQPPAG